LSCLDILLVTIGLGFSLFLQSHFRILCSSISLFLLLNLFLVSQISMTRHQDLPSLIGRILLCPIHPIPS
jgi:hypothetical protein